jgi:hypothetical protein
MSAKAARGVAVGLGLAVALAACVLPAQRHMSLIFDRPMVPEDVGRTVLRCGIQGDVTVGPSLEIWLMPAGLSQAESRCLRRQPHVQALLGAM